MFVPHLLNPLTMYVAHSIPKNMMIIILNFSFVDLPTSLVPAPDLPLPRDGRAPVPFNKEVPPYKFG